MDSETFRKAVKKATFDTSITEIVITSDGTTATIDTIGAANDRLVHVEFPFDVEGEWGITDPEKLIKSLKNISGKVKDATVKVMQKGDMLFISGHGKKYKFPVVDDVDGIRNRNTLIPSRDGADMMFSSGKGMTFPVMYKLADSGAFKKTIKDESVYKEMTSITFKNSMNLYGEDVTDFAAGDVVDGEFLVVLDGKVSSTFNGLDEVAKVLGKDNVTVCMGQDSMLYIDDIDGDVKSTFVIMPLEVK